MDGLVYYPQDHGGEDLYALDAATGEVEWVFTGTGRTDDAVTVKDGKLYTASDSIFCLNALTGDLIWANGIADLMGSTPIVFDGKVYCGNNVGVPDSSSVFCLDALTGSLLWSNTVPSYQASCMALWNGMLFVPTLPAGGGIIGVLNALDLNTGELLWQNTDSDMGYWDSSPVVVDGVIYINDWEKTFAFDAITGDKIWEQSTVGGTATIAFHNERLYFAGEGNTGTYYCLDASDGNTVWSVPGAQHGSSGIADGLVSPSGMGETPRL